MPQPGELVTESILMMADSVEPAPGEIVFFGRRGRFGVVDAGGGRVPRVHSHGIAWVYCPRVTHGKPLYCAVTGGRVFAKQIHGRVFVGTAVGASHRSGLVRMKIESPPQDPRLLRMIDRCHGGPWVAGATAKGARS